MKLIWVPFILAIFISNLSECTGQATKLCADAQCSETLFKTACSRDYDSNHEGLLKCEKGKDVTVYAISFSNRPDLVEAQTEDAKRVPFVFSLESALKRNQNFYMVSVEPQSTQKKVVGEKKANPHLLKLYEKYAKDLGIPVTTFEPIVSAEERQKASHSHGHGHSHGHSHEHPSEPTVSTEKVEPQAVSGVKVLADPTVAVLGNIKVSSNAQTNSEEAQQINTNSVAEEMQPVETISKTPDVLTKEADTQTNDAHYAAEAMPAASTTTPSIDEIPLEVAQANQTISNEIPSQQTLPVKLEQVSPPSDSAAKAAANVPPPSQPIVQPPVVSIPQKEPIVSQTQKQAPVTTISASVEQPPVTTIPDPVVQAQFEVPTTPVPVVQEQSPATTTSLPPVMEQQPAVMTTPAPMVQQSPELPTTPAPVALEQPAVTTTPSPMVVEPSITSPLPMKIQVTPSHLPPAGDFLHRKVVTPDNLANIKSQEHKDEENLPAPTPTIHPGTSTYPPGGRTASPQVNIDRLMNDLVGQIEEIKMAEPSVPPPQKTEEMEPTNDAVVQKSIPEGILPVAVKAEELVNVGEPPVAQQASAPSSQEQPVIESEQKKDELLSQDPVHIAVEGEKQNVASELNEQSNMNADGIAKSKESYCHKEDCGNFENVLGQNTADPSSSNSSNLIAVRSALREFVDHLRDMLPYPLSQFDVTGIFVLIFVLVSLVLHFINMCCFYETGRDVVDQKLLHDCMTRLKEQELALKKYQADSVHYQKLSRAGEAAEQLHQEKQRLELEYHSSKEEYSELQRRHIELDRVHEQVQNKLKGKMQEVAEASAKVEQRDAEIEQLNRNLQILQSLNEVTANDLTSAKKELEQQKHDHDALQSIYKDSQLEVERLTYKWQCSEEELGRQRSRNEELQTQVDEFLNIIRELKLSQRPQQSSRKSTPPSIPTEQGADLDNSLEQEENGGSNGSRSGGWSDLGDDTPGNGDEETADDTTMTSSKTTTRVSKSSSGSSKITGRRNLLSSDLLELAHLKGELRKTEAERDTLRFSLENEQKEKEGLSQRLEQLKQDLAEKRKEAERREGERHDLQSQCTKLLHMVDERDRKVEHIEEEREKLRSKISQLEVDWRQTEDDKRELAVKVKDLEQSLRRSEELNGKLENKIYHEERRLNAKVRMLEEQLNKAQSSVSPHNSGLGDLNMSGNSSDREFGPRVPLEVPSLWSDVEGPEMQFENVLYEMNRRPGGGTSNSLRQRNGGHQQRNSPALSNNNRTHGSSPFELEQIFGNKSNNSNSTMHTKEKRAPRARSRSTGRNSARLVGVDPDFKLDIKRSLLQK